MDVPDCNPRKPFAVSLSNRRLGPHAPNSRPPFAVSLSNRIPRFTGRAAWDSTSSPRTGEVRYPFTVSLSNRRPTAQ